MAENNAAAVAWIDRWPKWPAGGLALHGPPGCGKTHLSEVWRTQSGAVRIAPAALGGAEPPQLLGTARACVVDGLYDPGAGTIDERRLLHLYNLVRERRGQMLVTGSMAPARWPVRLADLKSRLGAFAAVEIGPPDDFLIRQVLVKLLHDRQLLVGTKVIEYCVRHMERSLGAAWRLVDALDREALASSRSLSMPLVREVLRRQFPAIDDLFDAGQER